MLKMLAEMSYAELIQFQKSDLSIKMYSEWQTSSSSINYFREYFGKKYQNKSFVFINDNEYLCGIFSFTNSNQLDFFGMPAVFEVIDKMTEEDYRICISFVYVLINSQAYYGVAASDRDLMAHKKLFSHALLFKAIEHSKYMGASKFILSNTHLNISDEKLNNIDFFKKGFTETIQCIPVMVFDLQNHLNSLSRRR